MSLGNAPFTPPTKIGDTPVEVMGEGVEFNGETWVTLVPPGDDDRLWEFSTTTGRLILTVG